ncbi:50S ribosomal protein L32 [Streptomyces sp. NPDC003090]|uniref:50S ribosomal protein L32 n=1 Tax=Streptomyces sp. NPDC003090 TaxID=3154274 RepID=UPI003809E2FE
MTVPERPMPRAGTRLRRTPVTAAPPHRVSAAVDAGPHPVPRWTAEAYERDLPRREG